MKKKDTLRNRLLRAFFIAIIPLFILLFVSIELLLVPEFEKQAKQELQNSTELLCNSIRTSANVAIRNHLKALAEQNLEVVKHYYNLWQSGLLSKSVAFSSLRSILLNQEVGSSGYLYGINSEGYVVFHPSEGVEHTNQSDFEFVREQMRLKQGYIEYDWKNPDELKERPKALYMVYFEPLDWIISVSSYRSEFIELLNPEDFRDNVLSLKFGELGYAYVLDSTGTTLIHPQLENFDFPAHYQMEESFVEKMLKTGIGTIEYEWQNPNDPKLLKKIAVYESIPEFGWTIVSSAYSDEVFKPVRIARTVAYGSLGFLFIGVFFIAVLLSKRIAKPLTAIMNQIDENARGNKYSPLPIVQNDEVGRLANEINKFLKVVEIQKKEITIEREKYQNLFQTSPTGIFLLKDLIFIDCNPATCEMFNAEYSDIIGKTVLDFSPEKQMNGSVSAKLAIDYVNQAIKESITSFEWIHLKLDGIGFFTEVQLKQFIGYDDELLLVAFVRDISKRKKAEGELNELNENLEIKVVQRTAELNNALKQIEDANLELQHLNMNIAEESQKLLHLNEKLAISEYELKIANQTKDKFFSIIAHDLKNPIGGMRNLLETLNFYYEKMSLDDIQQMIARLHSLSNMTVNLLENLLQWASIQTNRLSVNIKISAIVQSMRRNYDLAKPLAAEKYVKLDYKFDDNLTASYDENLLNAILRNLLTNAIKFSLEGGTVEFGAFDASEINELGIESNNGKSNSVIVFYVKDNGIGMSREVMEKLFRIDVNVTSLGTSQEKGTGLGLILCKEFVEKQGGKIWVESEVGKGSTFYFSLPKEEIK